MALAITLLGGFRLQHGDRLFPPTWRTRKARQLIALLALAPDQRLHREQVFDLLWPDREPDAARNNFYFALHVARQVLDQGGSGPTMLPLRGQLLGLEPPDGLSVDLLDFEAAAARARGSGEPRAHEAAIALYTGDLLPEDRYEDWATARRESVHGTWLQLLLDLGHLHTERREWVRAIDLLERISADTPTHEEAHVALMRCYALNGQRDQALRRYEQLSAALLRDLQVEPESATQALYAAILAGQALERGTRNPDVARASAERGINAPALGHYNVPASLTSFIGREREVAELRTLLEAGTPGAERRINLGDAPGASPASDQIPRSAFRVPRLLTLTGIGGVGKTRLALAVAAEVCAAYPDGLWLIELAALTDAALLPGAVVQALDLRDRPAASDQERLITGLREKQALIVLDNCEHLIDACAQLVADLLPACPRLRVLATSREALQVPGEVVRPIAPLSLPAMPAVTPVAVSLAELAASEALQLLVERIRQRQPDFALTAANAPALSAICRRLDGIPLALELAAAQAGHRDIGEIAALLDDALGLLTGDAERATARQQTLRGALDWSYRLLDPAEADLLATLAVFADGWTLTAAEAVCAEWRMEHGAFRRGPQGEQFSILTILAGLVEKSLVQIEHVGGEARYRLLEVVRQYARERLETRGGSAEAARQRHADYYCGLVKSSRDKLAGPAQIYWLDRLEREHDNLRTSLGWALTTGATDLLLQLTAGLWIFWFRRGHAREGLRWVEAALDGAGTATSPLRAEALLGAGHLAYASGDPERAERYVRLGLDLSRILSDDWNAARALNALGILVSSYDVEEAEAHYAGSLALAHQSKHSWLVAAVLLNQGELARTANDFTRAAALYAESLSTFRVVGDDWGIAAALTNLGDIARDREALEEALAHYSEATVLYHRLGYRQEIATSLAGLVTVATAMVDDTRAARLCGVVDRLCDTVGAFLWTGKRAAYDQAVATLRERLGAEGYTAHWTHGHALTVESVAMGIAGTGQTERRGQ